MAAACRPMSKVAARDSILWPNPLVNGPAFGRPVTSNVGPTDARHCRYRRPVLPMGDRPSLDP